MPLTLAAFIIVLWASLYRFCDKSQRVDSCVELRKSAVDCSIEWPSVIFQVENILSNDEDREHRDADDQL